MQHDPVKLSVNSIPARSLGQWSHICLYKNNRKKLQFITLLTAICIVSHIKTAKMIKVILLRAPCQNVNLLLSNITFIIFAVFDV